MFFLQIDKLNVIASITKMRIMLTNFGRKSDVDIGPILFLKSYINYTEFNFLNKKSVICSKTLKKYACLLKNQNLNNQISMKKATILLLMISLIFSNTLKIKAQETLNNQSIISLSQAKISKELIIDKIKASKCQFVMNTSGMIELAKASLKDQVIDAMMLATSQLPIMRNQDVIDLYNGKVPRDVITKKIQYSDCDFSTTTEAMIQLKNAKIPDQLVKVMMEPKRATTQSSNPNLIAGVLPPHPDNLPIPNRGSISEPGIYYEEFSKKPVRYEQLEPTTTNNTKRGTLGEAAASTAISRVSGGQIGDVVGTKQKVGLTNRSANFVIEDNRPVFYMVFAGNTRKNMDDATESIFGGVASPNDFVLLRVKASNRGREFVIGRESSYTSETGFAEGAVPFRFKKISNSLYKIYFEENISAAEYAFFYNKSIQFNSSIKLFDFSLKNNVK